MNIESSGINHTNKTQTQTAQKSQQDSSVKFADELNELKETESKKEAPKEEKIVKEEAKDTQKSETKEPIDNQKLDRSIKELSSVFVKLNQSEEKIAIELKPEKEFTDNTIKGENLINNDLNIK